MKINIFCSLFCVYSIAIFGMEQEVASLVDFFTKRGIYSTSYLKDYKKKFDVIGGYPECNFLFRYNNTHWYHKSCYNFYKITIQLALEEGILAVCSKDFSRLPLKYFDKRGELLASAVARLVNEETGVKDADTLRKLQEKRAEISRFPYQQMRTFALYMERMSMEGRSDLLPKMAQYLYATDGSIDHIRVPSPYFEWRLDQ